MADFDLPEPLTSAQLDEVQGHIDALKTLLGPKGRVLQANEIKALPNKMGERNTPFARDCVEAAKNNGGALPADFSTPQFEKSWLLHTQLSGIGIQLQQLGVGVGNTGLLAGSATMTMANIAYGHFQTGQRSNAALKPIVALLASYRKQTRTKTAKTAQTATTEEPPK